jgi:RNA polymerase sigma-70 factor (ECF subfamily)
MLADAADVSDAVQGATLKMIEGLGSYRGEARIESWARRIVVRQCLDILAARRRELASKTDSAGLAAPVPDAAMSESLPADIRFYLAQLSDAHREIIVLRHAMGHTIGELAEMLEVSENTVKSRLLHARRQIRKAIRRDVALGRTAGRGDVLGTGGWRT